MFRVGDVVSIMEDRVEVSKLQKGHGEWREDMTAVSIWICNRWYLEFSAVVPLVNLHVLLCKNTAYKPLHAVTWPTWTSGEGGFQCSTGCAGLSGWEEVDLQLCLPEACSWGKPCLLRT